MARKAREEAYETRIMRSRQGRGDKIFNTINYTFFVLMGICMVYPFWHILMYSISDVHRSATGGFFLLPRGFSMDAYVSVLKTKNIQNGFLVSVTVTVIGTVLGTYISAITAYCLSKKRLVGGNVIMFLIFFTMLFSGGMIPGYLLIKNLKMLNTLWALILPGLLSAWNIIIMRNFYLSVSPSLEESARIDGANDVVIFHFIILPISKAVIATISLFSAVGYWNDYFSSVLYITTNKNLLSMQFVLRQLLTDTANIMNATGVNVTHVQTVSTQSIRSTTVIVATIPILIVYPFLQKYFVKGVMLGAVKG